MIERVGPLIVAHYGTHCVVECSAMSAETAASAARLVAQVQALAAERVEPVEWRVFAHDVAASNFAAALDAAGFTAGWERSVLVAEFAELDFPELEPEWRIASIRWDEPEAQQALELSACSGPHRIPLARWPAGTRCDPSRSGTSTCGC